MEQHDQERSWKSDPRLHHMDAKKIALLASFADELAAAPEAQRMNLFLDLHRKMRQSNLVFSSEERDLLFSILTENLSPDGRKKGWRAVYGEEKEEITIPGWQEGDTLTPKGSSITEGKTKPKPLHTEATLLSAMETAGKEIEDDALRQAMKDCGIGTPATRASIIETLFKRGYMERCKKSLVPTEKGLALNSVVKTMRIADVAMTGEWEKELARIERGELSDDTFRKEIEAYTREITSELISCDKLFGSRDSGCACPKCGTGRMRFYGKVVRCDNTECGLPVFRLKAGRTLSDDEIKDLLTEGHTKLLKGFKSKQGKSFDAVVAFDGEYNTTFVFPEAKKDKKFSGRKK